MSRTLAVSPTSATTQSAPDWTLWFEVGGSPFSFELTRHALVVALDPRLASAIGAAAGEAPPDAILRAAHAADRSALEVAAREAAARPGAVCEMTLRLESAVIGWIHLDALLVGSSAGTVVVTGRVKASETPPAATVPSGDQRLRALAQYGDDAVVLFDPTWTCIYAAGCCELLYGYPVQDMSWTAVTAAIHPDDQERVLTCLTGILDTPGETSMVEYRLRQLTGDLVHVQSRFVNGFDDDNLGGLAMYTRDITTRKLLDPVTSLPNRQFLLERVRQVLSAARRHTAPFSLLIIKIDRPNISSDLGLDARRDLLRAIASRFRRTVGPNDTVSRVGPGRFAVLSEDMRGPGDASALADKLHASLFEAIVVGTDCYRASVSIGIAIGEPGKHSAEDLFRASETALSSAGKRGHGQNVVYRQTMQMTLMKRFAIENDLYGVAERDELELYYQPLFDMPTGALVGFEALVRWNHPTEGRVSPGLFIPIAEETGQIHAIGDFVLKRACADLLKWVALQTGAEDLTVSVNLSPEQITSEGIVERIDSLVRGAGLQPRQLKLELTETAFIHNPESVLEILQALKARGFSLSLDDFGTGYSSLSYLDRFPFDTLKVDRCFVSPLDSTDAKRPLARTIIELGHSMGMNVVAEGIETAEQGRILRAMGCDIAQGYFYGRPGPASEAEALIVARCASTEHG